MYGVGQRKRSPSSPATIWGTTCARACAHARCVTTFLMREFSARLAQRNENGRFKPMESVPAQFARIDAEECVVEPYIAGRFAAFNNNNGAVMDGGVHPVLQAFSHWSHHATGGRLMVAGLQGVVTQDCYACTGAVIHTASKNKVLPDSVNLGSAGMAALYKTHQRNDVCRLVGLPNVPGDAAELERFVEALARGTRPIAPYLADHWDAEATV